MKNIKYLFVFLLTLLVIPISVFAKEEIYGDYVTFFPSYDVEDTENNVVSTDIEGSISYEWVKIADSDTTMLQDLYSYCGEEKDDTSCDLAITKANKLLPTSYRAATDRNVTKADITSGSWVLWVRINTTLSEYKSYQIYKVAVKSDGGSNRSTTPSPQPDNSSSSSNPDTGLSNLPFIIVPVILLTGVVITLRKNKYSNI